MDLNAHMVRLTEIQDKIARGEEPTEQEVAYVSCMWKKMLAVGRKLMENIQSAVGVSSFSELERRLEGVGEKRWQRVIAERDAARSTMAEMHQRQSRRRLR